MDVNDKNYGCLARVLQMAYDQAATGKGNDRHGNGLPFHQQPMQAISGLLGNYDGMAYQVCKKVTEARNLPTKEARVRELLGVIVYAAGMVIYEDRDLFNVTSVTIDTSKLDADTLRKMECQLGREGLLEPGEMVMREIERNLPAVPKDDPVHGSDAKTSLPRGPRSKNYPLANAVWMPGVEGGDDWIQITMCPMSVLHTESSALQAAQLAATLARFNKGTEVTIVLETPEQNGYRSTIRSTITGELLNSPDITIEDVEDYWDRITVVYEQPATEQCKDG